MNKLENRTFVEVILLLELHEIDQVIDDFDKTKELSSGSKRLLDKLHKMRNDKEVTCL